MPLERIPAMSELVMGRSSSQVAVCGKWRSGGANLPAAAHIIHAPLDSVSANQQARRKASLLH